MSFSAIPFWIVLALSSPACTASAVALFALSSWFRKAALSSRSFFRSALFCIVSLATLSAYSFWAATFSSSLFFAAASASAFAFIAAVV